MSKESVSRLIGVIFSVAAGLIVQFLVRQPLLAAITFVSALLLTAIIVSHGLPIRISLDRSHRLLFGVTGYYKDQDTARSDIVTTAHASKRIDIMLIRGHTFILDEHALLEEMIKGVQNVQVRILLLDPHGTSMKSYLNSRRLSAEEQEQYLAKCSLVKRHLDDEQRRQSIEYKYYDHFPSFKVIVADSHAFVAPYDTRRRGSKLPYIAYGDMGRPFFVAFSNYFEQVWLRFSSSS
jgi:hypothetical protein